MHTAPSWSPKTNVKSWKTYAASTGNCQHSKHICDESAVIREIAREIRHMFSLRGHRRRKQSRGYTPLRGLMFSSRAECNP